MYTLIRSGLTRETAVQQIPSLGVTMIIAELFYKFHSFTLEFLAALATWFVVDLVASAARLATRRAALAMRSNAP